MARLFILISFIISSFSALAENRVVGGTESDKPCISSYEIDHISHGENVHTISAPVKTVRYISDLSDSTAYGVSLSLQTHSFFFDNFICNSSADKSYLTHINPFHSFP